MDCSLPGSSIHGIFQARVLEWVAISFSRGSSWPRDRTQGSCIAGRCFTLWATREVAKGLTLDHSMVVHHLKQIGKMKKLYKWVPHELSTKPPPKKSSFWGVIFSYSMQQQWTISWSDCDMWQKVDFIQQPSITSSLIGLRRSSKELPKAKVAHPPPKKKKKRKEKGSLSLLGGLLLVCFTKAFWIPAKPLYMKSMLSKLIGAGAQSCTTLYNSMDCSSPCSFIHGTFQARILEWVAISYSRGFSWPRDWPPPSLASLTLADIFFTTSTTNELQIDCCCSVAQSCLTLCNLMDCSMPGFLILHHILAVEETLKSLLQHHSSKGLILQCK